MSDITKKSLTEIVDLLKKKEIKSEEVTTSFIDNIKKDKKLNSFITNCNEQALERAKNFDKSPKLDSLLPGVPIAVKDLSSIFKFIEQLNELNTDKTEPLSSILNEPLRSRKDVVNDGKIRERILENSPQKNDEFFVVQKVID